MMKKRMVLACFVACTPLAVGGEDKPTAPFSTESGDFLITILQSPTDGPAVMRFGNSVERGEMVDLGPDITLHSLYAIPTRNGDIYLSHGTFVNGPGVVRIDGETGEVERLFSANIFVQSLEYDEDRDLVYATMIQAGIGTQLYAFGPDDRFVPTLLFVNNDFNSPDLLGVRNRLSDLTLDGVGNLYVNVEPYIDSNFYGNERIARIDAETGELTLLRDKSGELVQFENGIEDLVAMPDGRLIIHSAPFDVGDLRSRIFVMETDGEIRELLNFNDPLPFDAEMMERVLAVESDDTFIFPARPTTESGDLLLRYRLSTGDVEIAAYVPGGFPTNNGSVDIEVVPQRDAKEKYFTGTTEVARADLITNERGKGK